MRWLVLFLLLSGCGSRSDDAPGGDSAGADAAAAQRLAQELSAQGEAGLRRRLESLSAILTDPAYRNVRNGPMGAVCGEVDTKEGSGRRSGFKPFVIAPDGFPLISTTPEIMFDDPSDMFPDAYIRWCASPEEMERIAAVVARRGAVPAGGTPVDVPEPALDPLLIPPVPAPVVAQADPPAAAPPPAARAREAQPSPSAQASSSNEDSFFRSVVRPPAEKETAR